jgi:hypothetical protein
MAAAEQKVQAILEAGDDPFALLVRCNCCPARGALIRADGRLTLPSWSSAEAPRAAARRARSAQVGRRGLHDHSPVPSGALQPDLPGAHRTLRWCRPFLSRRVCPQLSLCCHPDKNTSEDAEHAFHRE